MRIQNLVGRKAIRTRRIVAMQFDMQKGYAVPVKPSAEEIEKYTEEPVTVISAVGCQIVVEESDGTRRLLPRGYNDDFWTDYEKLMHPEEERRQKTKALLDELYLLSEPIKDFLKENFDPMCQVVIDMDGACVTRSEMGTGKDGKRNRNAEQEEKESGRI